MKRYLIILLTIVMVLSCSVGNAFAGDYTVKSGDTLWEIAKKLNVTMNTLIEINKLQDPGLIYPGQVLKTSDNSDTVASVTSDTANVVKAKPQMITPKLDIDEAGGADAYDNSGDHPDSKYYVNPDFYNMKSNEEMTILSGFKTFQQTSEWSCGNATVLMVLEHFGVHDYSEWDIAVKSNAGVDLDVAGSVPGSANNFPEYGTSVDDMIRFFDTVKGFRVVETSYKLNYAASDLIQEGDTSVPSAEWGNLPGKFNGVSLYASENLADTEKWVDDAKDSYFVKWITGHLQANRPILVEWCDWDGHWQAIIGYDTQGTAGIGDDVIIFADPYDTSDSWQDGYYYYPAERWFYMWSDRAVAPKPYQLQPYLVVEPVQ